jgi:galactokinase
VDVANAAAATSWPTLAAYLASAPDALDRLRDRLASHGSGGFSGVDLRTRLTHFLAEDGRVPQAAAAFRSEDVGAIGALSAASQADADALLDNQTPETRLLARLAREHGAFASSSFGAGFGGSVWALAEADQAPAFALRWLEAYRAEFPAMGRAEIFITRPGPGVVELPISE